MDMHFAGLIPHKAENQYILPIPAPEPERPLLAGHRTLTAVLPVYIDPGKGLLLPVVKTRYHSGDLL